MAKLVLLMDIDGVLANSEIRDQFETEIQNEDFSWFHDRVPIFSSYEGMPRLLRAMAKDCEIIYITARDICVRDSTQLWLDRHGFPPGPLHMRVGQGPDTDIKRRLFTNIIKPHRPDATFLAFDDKIECIDMWNEFGITTFHVKLGKK